jgi:hypothetical protein
MSFKILKFSIRPSVFFPGIQKKFLKKFEKLKKRNMAKITNRQEGLDGELSFQLLSIGLCTYSFSSLRRQRLRD